MTRFCLKIGLSAGPGFRFVASSAADTLGYGQVNDRPRWHCRGGLQVGKGSRFAVKLRLSDKTPSPDRSVIEAIPTTSFETVVWYFSSQTGLARQWGVSGPSRFWVWITHEIRRCGDPQIGAIPWPCVANKRNSSKCQEVQQTWLKLSHRQSELAVVGTLP